MSSCPVFQQVYYISPFGSLPQGWNKVGVVADVEPPESGDYVLAGQLVCGGTETMVVVALVATEVVLVPPMPLSASESYVVNVQWVAPGTDPSNIAWSNSDVIASSPVVTAVVQVLSGTLVDDTLQVAFSVGSGGCTPTGVGANVLDQNGRGAGYQQVEGASVDVPLTLTAGNTYVAYLQGVLPTEGQNGFAGPFSLGPPSAGIPVPTDGAAVTSVTYDGQVVQVEWTPPTLPANVPPVSYWMEITGGDQTLITPAVETGGLVALGAIAPGTALTVAARVDYGCISGPAGGPATVITTVPIVSKTAFDASGPTVSAAVAFPDGTPDGAAANAYLMVGGTVLAGPQKVSSSGGTASFGSDVTGAADAVVTAQLVLDSGYTSTGPSSAGAVVAPAAPLYDGIVVRSDLADPDQYTIDVQWSPPSFPQVDWQTATVTLSQGGVTVGTVTTSGSSAAFSVKSGDAGSGTLAPGSVADVSITLTGPDGTSPAATATVICASPTIQSVLNVQEGDPSGESVGVKVTTNAGADGQLLTVQLLADGRVVATASGLTTNTVNLPLTGPLDPSVAFTVQVRWTGNGVDDSTFGGWSAEAPVSSATTQILAARYNGTDVMFETAQALGAGVSQGVYAYAIDTRRGRVSGQVVMGNVGSFPLSGTGNWQIGAQPIVPLVGEGASNSVAPTCPTLPLLIAAPSIQSVEYDGSTVSIEFDPVNDTGGNPSTSSEVEIVIGGEPIAQFTAGSDGASIPFVMRETYVTPSVRVRAVNGPIVGPLSARMPIPTEAPTVTAVQVGASITATVTAPDGAEALACLMSGDAIVAGPDRVTEGSIEFDFDASGTSGLSIVARSMMTGFFGPYSPAVPVLGQPPEVTALAIDAPGDGTWVLTGTWNPSDDPNVTGYTMALMDGSTTVSSSNTNTMVVAQSDVDPTTSYTVTVAADGIDQARSPFTTLPVLFDAPVLTATQYDGSEVAASWAPPNSLGSVTDPQFRIALIDASGGVVRTSEVVSGVAGSVSLPESLLALGVTAVRVQVVAGVVVLDPGANGPDGTQATLQSATVGPIETVTDASSGAVVLQWGAIDGATYAIELSDGTSDTAADASYPMPTAPMPGAPLTARVSATQNSQGVANTGPWSAQSAVVTAATTITAVSWDGTNATVSWEGLEATTGTVVSVLADDGVAFQATAPPAATTLSFQPAVTDASKTYTVVVQPQVSGSTGPASEAEPLFAWGWFPSRVPATTAAPYLYPALTYAEAMSATLGTSGPDLTLYLGDVAAGGSIELPVGDGPFVLDEGSGNWPYKLTLSGDIWAFDTSPVRSGLVTALTTFLQQCETAGVVAWGVDQLLQAISRAMPQTFDELLYYAYGLTFPGNGAVHGTVDLRPGMILRVASSDYMTVSGASSSTWLPGYTGTSVMDYEVSSYTGSSGWLIGFDAFVARLIANGALSVDAPPGDIGAEAEGGLAAAADLFYPAFQQPFYRLFFPSTLLSASDEGSNQPAANFAIAACSSYTQLTTATNVPAAGNTVAYFRGRSVLEVLIRVTVNGVELTVPVGTTVGNLLDRFGCRPTSIAATLEGLELTRTRGPAVIDPDAALDPGGSTPVGLSWMGLQVYAPGIDALSMPLLHGDILTLKG